MLSLRGQALKRVRHGLLATPIERDPGTNPCPPDHDAK
jgi:hypothetical protein